LTIDVTVFEQLPCWYRMELFREKAFELLELMDNSLPTVTRLR
jgi:hypothetical protein